MKTVIAESSIAIDEQLSQAQPLVVVYPPFDGEQKVLLKIKESENCRVLCSSLGKKEVQPYYFKRFQELPESFFVVTRDLVGYRAFFCLSHGGMSLSLVGDGRETALVGKGRIQEQLPALVCVQGDNIYQTVALAIRLGLKLVGSGGKLSDEKPPLDSWLETLGWESGGAFGFHVTHDKILNAVWGLRQMGFQPGYVLIDDGWQESKSQGLSCFSADTDRFPYGLDGLVEELQRAGVHHVGISHPIMGSIGGISSGLAEQYQLKTNGSKRGILGLDLGKTFQFYHDFYRSLRRQGISFVKVKHQTEVNRFVQHGIDLSQMYGNLQSAIQAASSLHFDAPHLNSECLHNENLFYWTKSRLACAADDLDTQSVHGVRKAIRNILGNSFWLQYFMKPDFNGWTTGFPQSSLMALLHALSGTTNVISDPPGKNDGDLLKKSVLPSGNLLKTDHPLTLCEDSVFINPLQEPKLYKGFTFKGVNGVLAVFNISRRKKPLQEMVSALDIEGITGVSFAVFSHSHGFFGVYKKEDLFPITVKQNEADVMTFSPVRDGVALIGCYLFYLAAGPIQEVTLEEYSMHITSLVTAPMIMYSEKQVMEIRRNGDVVPWEYDDTKKLLTIDSRSTLREIPTVYTITFE